MGEEGREREEGRGERGREGMGVREGGEGGRGEGEGERKGMGVRKEGEGGRGENYQSTPHTQRTHPYTGCTPIYFKRVTPLHISISRQEPDDL